MSARRGQLAGQLDLFARAHVAEAYQLDRLWGLDRGTDGSGWWAWRCSCGRDPGAERRAASSGRILAEFDAIQHEHRHEPWAVPDPGLWWPFYLSRKGCK